MRFSLVVLALVVIGSAVSAKVKFSPLERRIIQITDERRNADSLVMFLGSNEENVAWRAAWGIGNIGDTTVRPQVIARLAKETRPAIVDIVAWSLGTLGENANAYEALAKIAVKQKSNEVLRTLGRTVPKSNLSSFKELLTDLGEGPKAPAFGISLALIDVSLRKLMDGELVEIALKHAKSPDVEIAWRATYSLSRTEDSAGLAPHLGEIRELLNDLGMPEIRMFAALALGRVHNDSAMRLLTNATRSEQDWRVRVNIMNALGRSPRMTSSIFDAIKRVTDEASSSNILSEHVANAALMTLDAMLAANKVSGPDSITIRDWLTEYDPNKEARTEQSFALRGQAVALLTRFGGDAWTLLEAADHIASFRDRTATLHVLTAYGSVMDTLAFQRFMGYIAYPETIRLPFTLGVMRNHWQLAQKHKEYWHDIESSGLGNTYRHALIRIASLVHDPAVLEEAMQSIQDTSILNTPEFRAEAEEYLLKYLDYFKGELTLDQMMATLSALKWLKPKGDHVQAKVRTIYEWAADQGYGAVADSAHATLDAIGAKPSKLTVKLRRKPIDWTRLETAPDSLLVQNAKEMMFIKLHKYDAPLTCLNMIELASNSYFATNYFHRVVPNFVIQTGDPTGTGSGGPGYSIRREISPISYDIPGVVGMASSGKDTEGSQWFATHLPTPHLDTRYTIWGQITGGLPAVELFLRNDKIDNIIPFSMK